MCGSEMRTGLLWLASADPSQDGVAPSDDGVFLCRRLPRTSCRPLVENPSSEDVTSVWSLPHTHPLPNHGLYLCLPVFPV